jgi:hypothetical protein
MFSTRRGEDIDNHFTGTQLVSQVFLSSSILPVVLPHLHSWNSPGILVSAHLLGRLLTIGIKTQSILGLAPWIPLPSSFFSTRSTEGLTRQMPVSTGSSASCSSPPTLWGHRPPRPSISRQPRSMSTTSPTHPLACAHPDYGRWGRRRRQLGWVLRRWRAVLRGAIRHR